MAVIHSLNLNEGGGIIPSTDISLPENEASVIIGIGGTGVETIKKLNGSLRQREIDWNAAGAYRNAAVKMLKVLGIDVKPVVLSEEDRELFAGWNAAKAEKDFAKADEFRAKLMERGLL